MGLTIAKDNKTVYVANYLADCVQKIDIESRKIVLTIPLSQSRRPSLARRGMEIFYDGRRSLDQWYSCHSCHYNGGVNSKAMDTLNDGSALTMKTVLPLQNLSHTSPWTWHGWQKDLHNALNKSFTETMQGPAISQDDRQAVLAFLETLKPPPNPFRAADGSLTDSARRGKAVFESGKAGCAECHSGPYFTDGEIHDVGLGSSEDRYKGFNTPSLLSVYRKARLLHDGRAKSLRAVLTGAHAPEDVAGEASLATQELADLIEYLKSL
jgi:cytochrome c peroxidase